jgi:hypothetical protein
MRPHALYRVQTADGLGVREASLSPGSRLRQPVTCPLGDAACLHRAEANKLRRWAISYGIPAQCVRLTPDPPKPDPIAALLRNVTG